MSLIQIASDFTLRQVLLAPLEHVAERAEDYRRCNELTDDVWLELGVTRVLSDAKTGRGFLQQIGSQLDSCPSNSHFFETLKSKRRLKICQAANASVAAVLTGDPFAQYPTLGNFEIFAADGHWHAAAVHDEKIDDRRWPVGHLYAQNMRTQALHHLAMNEGKKENDIHVLKRIGADKLRMGAPKGRKVLWVYDRACIDFQMWYFWKKQHGIYFISRTKENMLREVIAENNFDAEDPFNGGVRHDQMILTSQGVSVRMITYEDPATGTTFEFITSDITLPPGIIAYLYLRRWDIEKTYDQFKNKYSELKAWASSDTAKHMQAEFICLAHNLLQLFNAHLEQQHQLRNHAEDKRRALRHNQIKDKALARKASLCPLIKEGAKRLTQISLKLLRWLRAFWFSRLPLALLTPRLAHLYSTL
jgi:hypothetical protein